ncbi:MAG: histidine kinase [Bacteroidales bacterium]|nr:histidine kinase [Bacteroidales bacterium]MCF8391894.1 histidine kinase [Bacteroidales bacterium]
MQIIYNRRIFIRNTILLILAVAIFLSILYYLSDKPKSSIDTFLRIIHGLTMTAGLWIGCMAIVNYLWKKFPWQESPLKHLVIEIILIFTYTIAFSFIVYSFGKRFFDIDFTINIFYDIFNTLLITFFITAIYESVYFYRQWIANFSKSIKLEKDNIEANYEILKANLNPHFLFNSLNSLMNLVDDNPRATKYISNLSEFLRYLLNSAEKELADLGDEINILEKYIELQKLRFENSFEVKINVDQPELYKIPPLVLQILVENCIKHNEISTEKPLKIDIYNEAKILWVQNNINLKKGVESTGKGLKNIRDRYKLFTSQNIETDSNDNIFRINVPLLTMK